MNRASALLEWSKALYWEPRALSAMDLALTLTPHDFEVVRRMGGRPVMAANGMSPRLSMPSPPDGVVLAVGDWRYGPNRSGLAAFLAQGWQQVLDVVPGARMRVVGRGAEGLPRASGVEPVGFVAELSEEYARSAVVLAPATTGGGAQLKVAEALAYNRLVVGPPYVERSRPSEVPDAAVRGTLTLPSLVIDRLCDVDERHATERLLGHATSGLTWTHTLGDAVERIWRLASMAREGRTA
ncbi:hypothetical protein ASD16_11725 [Cellulomonas sp. Root485]|nr:hypothetical protein ASD16_11725 [Cellulomonas sp. Root485]